MDLINFTTEFIAAIENAEKGVMIEMQEELLHDIVSLMQEAMQVEEMAEHRKKEVYIMTCTSKGYKIIVDGGIENG